MIELTLEQSRAVALANALSNGHVGKGEDNEACVKLIDPTTQKTYMLVEVKGDGLENEPPLETPAPPWQHLVVRDHPWRKQLYIKGRNMTVRHLVGWMMTNKMTQEQVADDYGLPVEAVREALAYFAANPEVIALDHATEMYLVSQHGGRGRGPESVPR